MIAYDYKIHTYVHFQHERILVITVEAHYPPRNDIHPVFEASWKADGTPSGACRMLPDNTDCEKCEHIDIPPAVYVRFVEEITRLRDALSAIIARTETGTDE